MGTTMLRCVSRRVHAFSCCQDCADRITRESARLLVDCLAAHGAAGVPTTPSAAGRACNCYDTTTTVAATGAGVGCQQRTGNKWRQGPASGPGAFRGAPRRVLPSR